MKNTNKGFFLAFHCLFSITLLTGNSIAAHYQLTPAQDIVRTARRAGRRFESLFLGEEGEDE